MKTAAPAAALSPASVSAVILAGGVGSRLKALTHSRQKVVLPIHGRPLLAYLLQGLDRAGLRHAVLCTGFMGGQVRDTFGTVFGGITLEYSCEDQPLGTGGAIRQALALTRSDPVLVMNGDSYLHLDFPAFFAWHREHGRPGTLALKQIADAGRYGTVSITKTHDLSAFREKDPGLTGKPGLINGGIYLFARGLLDTLPATVPLSIEREVFPGWIGKGLSGFTTDGDFLDIGVPEDYSRAAPFFAAQFPDFIGRQNP